MQGLFPKSDAKVDSFFLMRKRWRNFFCQCGEFSAEIKNLLSTGKCKIIDLSEENAFGRVKIEFLVWSAVDFVLDIADECIRQG